MNRAIILSLLLIALSHLFACRNATSIPPTVTQISDQAQAPLVTLVPDQTAVTQMVTLTPTLLSPTPILSVITVPTTTLAVISPTATIDNRNCSTFTWAYGPPQPGAASQVQEALAEMNITAKVEAGSYGETDGCGGFHLMSIDFTVSVETQTQLDREGQENLVKQILPVLREFGRPNLGYSPIIFDPGGDTCVLNQGQGEVCQWTQ
jgi:hypothetical protein